MFRNLVKYVVLAFAAIGAQQVYSETKLNNLPAPHPATRVRHSTPSQPFGFARQ